MCLFGCALRPHLKQQDHGLEERLEVVDLVQCPPVLDVHEEGHAEDGENEHHEEQKQTDVEEGRY